VSVGGANTHMSVNDSPCRTHPIPAFSSNLAEGDSGHSLIAAENNSFESNVFNAVSRIFFNEAVRKRGTSNMSSV
jgi:hypothetical protein